MVESPDFDQGLTARRALWPQSVRLTSVQSAACVALMLVVLVGRSGSGVAQVQTDAADKSAEVPRGEVIVTATRQAPDEQITAQVERALAADPYIYAEHVTVTTNNGVVRVEGIVWDTGERFRILRRCRKIPGTRRVVDALEILDNDPDGG